MGALGKGMTNSDFFIRLLTTLLLSCAIARPLYAQSSDWAELPLPNTGNVSALHVNGDTLLAARGIGLRNNGVYRSTDKGQSWTEVSGFEKNTDGSVVGCFVAANNALYATGRGVMRSMDGGLTWMPLNNGLRLRFLPDAIPPIGCLAINGEMLAATAGFPYQSVFISTDGGANWGEQNTGLPVGTNFIYGPAVFGENNLLMQVSFRLFRYRQDARSWTLVGPANTLGFPFIQRNSLIARGKNLFIIAADNTSLQQVFRSSDGGTSWTGFMRGLPTGRFPSFSRVLGLTTDGNWLYATATAGTDSPLPSSAPAPTNLYLSDDEGETWGAASKSLGFDGNFITQSQVNPLALSGADVYAANGTKLFRTTLQPPAVSSASYRALDVTSGGIATVFGSNLATATQTVEADAPAAQLADVTVQVTDSAGRQRNAFVFFASPTQINFQIPPESATGLAAVSLAGTNQVWRANVATTAPSLFTADASGKGLPAGVALRVKADGAQSYEAIFQYDAQNNPVALPLDVSRADETVYLVLFGTGIRGRSDLAKVTAQVGGLNALVEYAGISPGFVGLDQINLRLPRALAGRGEVEIELQADGKKTNPVKAAFK